jgi:hypothetical protein
MRTAACAPQVPLRDDQLYIPGLLNGQGTKVSWLDDSDAAAALMLAAFPLQ